MRNELYDKLAQAFCPTHLEVHDDSHKHAGHAEAKIHGGGHYRVVLVTKRFENLGRLERQRLVHGALAGFFEQKSIHALSLKLYTPQEWSLPS